MKRTAFTTGQIATLCNVAPRTVSKWFDSGRLQGYRIPGSQDRRVPVDNLISFMKQHGMPLNELEEYATPSVLVMTTDAEVSEGLQTDPAAHDMVLHCTGDMFEAGAIFREQKVKAVIADLAINADVMLSIIRRVLKDHPKMPIFALAVNDNQYSLIFTEEPSIKIFRRPFDTHLLACQLQRTLGLLSQ